MISANTQRLLSFLGHPEAYPYQPRQVTLIQTHASWVFIAPPFVYKLKQPVNLGFLDFSTLDLRHADCEREVVLNLRLAPDVYLGVEPIVDNADSLHIGGPGKVFEWAVKMRAMDPRYAFKQLLKEHAVNTDTMDRIITRLHHFYTAQPPLPAYSSQSANERLRQYTEDNFSSARQFVGRSVSAAALAAIAHYTREFFNRQSTLLASRIEQGHIRDGHGDLHLEHIHLTPDQLSIFDCLEFNADLRQLDVACDLAFLAMDLDFNDRPDLARYLVRRFAELQQDPDSLRVMDFYKCYRACVRGKVESLHAHTETATEAEREASLLLAQRYFRHALHYAIAASTPRVFVFMGKVASGKSALAEALGGETQWPVFSSDLTRKTLTGTSLHHRGTEAEREALYSIEVTQQIYDELFPQAMASLTQGHCCIIDATFSKQEQRTALVAKLSAVGFPVTWIEAHASESMIRQRLMARDHDESVVSDARYEDYARLSAGYEPPLELLPADLLGISTDGELAQVFRTLLSALSARI